LEQVLQEFRRFTQLNAESLSELTSESAIQFAITDVLAARQCDLVCRMC
jgi:hypothetical protein